MERAVSPALKLTCLLGETDITWVYETQISGSNPEGDASDECRCCLQWSARQLARAGGVGSIPTFEEGNLGDEVLTHQLLSSPSFMSPSSNGSGSLVLSEKIRVRLPVGTLQAHSLVSSGRRSDKSEVEVQFLVRLPRVVNAVGITIQTSGRGFESRRSPRKRFTENVAQLVERRSQKSLCVPCHHPQQLEYLR